MKIKCPHCSTNYSVDDSKISEKGLLVKCSVCQNQYRIKKKQEDLPDDDIVGQTLNMMSTKSDNTEKQSSENIKEKPALKDPPSDSTDYDSGLFSQTPPSDNNKTSFNESDFSNDDDGEENTLNLKLKKASAENSVKTDGNLNNADKLGNDLGKLDKEFEEDSLFGDIPSKRDYDNNTNNAADALFKDDFTLSDEKDSSGLFKEKAQPDDFLKELFQDSDDTTEDHQNGIYFRNRKSGKITGPIEESKLEKLMSEGIISENDDVSFDGMTWEPGHSATTPKEDKNDDFSFGLSIDDNESEAFETLNFDKGSYISKPEVFTEAISEFEDASFNSADSHEPVDHVFIPDELTISGMDKNENVKSGSIKKGAGTGNTISFYAILGISTIIILGLIGGGVFYYLKFIKGNKGDILDNISESIAVNTGTLIDVREALNKDTPSDYISSIGILKQYIKSDDSAPSAVGLDGQVKFNLLISYNKRVESSVTTNEKIDEAMKKSPGNIDLIKAKSLSLYEEKRFDEALALIQPFAKINDYEVFYILGLCAAGKNDLQKAEQFFNAGFNQSNGKSIKIMYALAEMKNRNGFAQSAIAFLNRIITENSNYLKAYLLKARIMMNTEGKLDEAEQFLKGVAASVISESEDFQKAEYYQMLATIVYKLDKINEAIEFYEKAVEINKTDTAALVTIGDFYVQTSNSSKAMEYYDKALKIDAKNTLAILGKTEIFIQLGQKDRVFLEIAKLEVPSITDAPSLIRLGKIYDNTGDKAKALEYYDLSIKSNPALIEPYVSKMVILLELGKIKEIDEIATILSKLGKESYAYNFVKGIVLYEEANFKKAEEFLRKALERNPMGDERVFYYYGLLLFDQQKYSEASVMLEKAYKANSRNYSYIQAFAESLEKEKKFKSVIDLLESGEYNEKRMYKSYLSLANAFYSLEKYEESLNYINKGLELNNHSTYLFYMKSKIYYAMGKYNDAEKEIDTAVILDMRNFDNYMIYARILSKKGDFKGAIEKIEAAERIDSSNQELMLMKGIVYRNLDDFRSALQYFRKVKDSSFRKEASLEIGECYLQLNNKAEALKYFKKAEASGNKLANKHLAIMYYEAGKLDTAVSYYRKALRADKTDIIAMKQLGYIYKEKNEWGKALSYLKMYYKRITDPYEKRMIQDEIYYLEKNLPHGQVVKNAENPEELDANDPEALEERAKELYIEGRALRQEDPKTAREKFREIMNIVPKTSTYYKKAFKAFNDLGSEDSK